MENNCQNCGELINGNFCSNCGQKKYRRIDRKYIVEEVQYSLLHTNKGFFYSIKKILKNPGKTAREFVDGNRVNHYKPILLAFVLSGISAFISIKLIGIYKVMETYSVDGKSINTPGMQELMSFVTSYNSFLAVLMIPFFAFLSKLAFYKWGHNYYEHVVMNAFFQSFYTIIYIIFLYPLMFLAKDNSAMMKLLLGVSVLILPFLMVWFYKEFYTERKISSIMLRILSIFLILGVLYVVLIFIVVVIGVILYPETFQQMKEAQSLNNQ